MENTRTEEQQKRIDEVRRWLPPLLKGRYGQGSRYATFQVSYPTPTGRKRMLVSYVPARDGQIEDWLNALGKERARNRSDFLVNLVANVALESGLRGHLFTEQLDEIRRAVGLPASQSTSRTVVALARMAWADRMNSID